MENKAIKSIVLGGGCFWCVEAVFQRVQGVQHVESGYAGGSAETANYEAVCSKMTKHVEVVKIDYDPSQRTLEELLEIFWTVHDPTTPNQQGNDKGPQYRSAIFYASDQEKEIAENSIRTVASSLWTNPVVTELLPLETFYPAESYHQSYYNKVGNRNPYCTFVINPKVAKLKKSFSHFLKSS